MQPAGRAFPKADRAGQLVVLASGREGDTDALPIDQDAAVLGATLEKGQKIMHKLSKGRQAYIVGALGRFTVNGKAVSARDGVVVQDAEEVVIEAVEPSEILVADLP